MEVITSAYVWSVALLAAFGIVPWRMVALGLAMWSALSVVNIVRTLVAHHYANDEGEPLEVIAQVLDSASVPPPALLPMLWAPVGLRYHALHHLLPNLPYHSLGEAHRRLTAGLPAGNLYELTAHRRARDVMVQLLKAQARPRTNTAGQRANPPLKETARAEAS
jgi:fatty acid desaturase